MSIADAILGSPVPAIITCIVWNRIARCVAFWLIVTVVSGGLYAVWSSLPLPILGEIVAEGFGGDLARVSSELFAFSLAKALVSLGFGLLIAFGILHALAVSVSIGRARALIRSYKSKIAFANDLERVRERMEAHPLLGHAWKKFQESVIPGGKPVRNTQRPQSFFNYAMLREKCIGLKIMPGRAELFRRYRFAPYLHRPRHRALQGGRGNAGGAARRSGCGGRGDAIGPARVAACGHF